MPPRIIAVANQKGGVGKTTLTVNLAAVTHDVLESAASLLSDEAAKPEESQVLAASIDPQASMSFWSRRVEKAGGVPFDFVQIDDPHDLAKLRRVNKKYVFIDTPGSLDDERKLLAALEVADEVLVPMPPEPLAFDPTRRTIESVIRPTGLPFHVVVNDWEPRDGKSDLLQTAGYIRRHGWPFCGVVIRHYKLHTRASAEGLVVTQYPKNRVAMEAREDFFRLALERGYGGAPGSIPLQTTAADMPAAVN